MTVYPFTEFQISFLRGLFYQESAPPPHNTRVNRLARTDEGGMIVEYEKYGRFQTEIIIHDETPDNHLKIKGIQP